MATTFHSFSRLPPELRLRIWELTIEPRTVDARYQYAIKKLHVTWSPVPGALQACHESRSYLSSKYYQQGFTAGCEPRYVWVNFNIDMISIGGSKLRTVRGGTATDPPAYLSGKSDEWFFYFQSHDLVEFKNLKELHVVCEEDLLDWEDSWDYAPWPCPRESITFIHKEIGQVVVGEGFGRMLEEAFGDEEPTSE